MGKHDDLLDDYADELADAKQAAEAWWAKLQVAEAARGGTAAEAAGRLRRRWPDGPASHPLVLRVIRKYWLACEALNQAALATDASTDEAEPEEHGFDPELTEEDSDGDDADVDDDDDSGDDDDSDDDDRDDDDEEGDDEVYPHVFIHEWLGDDHEELFEFLTHLTYWPIGLDANESYT